jgi:hypothetical protein
MMLIMKRYLLFITMILCGLAATQAATAQNNDKRKAAREQWYKDMEEFRQRSAPERKLESEINAVKGLNASNALEAKYFVFETESISYNNGPTLFVNSHVNFISLKDSRAVVQISPNNFAPGDNGVGGITVDGMPTDMSYEKDEKGRITFSMSVMGRRINAQVVIDMVEGSDIAHATIKPNFGPNRTIWMKGKLVPFDQSSVFEGMSR